MRSPINEKQRVTLAVGIVTLAAILVCTMMSRVLVFPVIPSDIAEHLSTGEVAEWMRGFRTPLYGWLLRAAFAARVPGAIVALQAGLWVAAIACATLLAALVTRSSARALFVGIGLLMGELYLIQTLPMQWKLHEDALYAVLNTAGILLLLIGCARRSPGIALLGSASLGAVAVLKPMLVPLVIGTAGGIAALHGFWHMRRKVVLACAFAALLWGPTMSQSTSNMVVYGTPRLSPLAGLHATTVISSLLEPGDRVFADPATDRAFHEAAGGKIFPAKFDAAALAGTFPREPWFPILTFFGSLTEESDIANARFAASRMSEHVLRRLILLHPVTYASQVVSRLFNILIPTQNDRLDLWQKDPMELYDVAMLQLRSDDIRRAVYGDVPHPWMEKVDLRMAAMLSLPSSIGRLPYRQHWWLDAIIALGILLIIARGISLLMKKKHPHSMLGLALLLCITNTGLHAAAQASITALVQPRFALPGMMTMEIAVLLFLASFRLPMNETSAGTPARRMNS